MPKVTFTINGELVNTQTKLTNGQKLGELVELPKDQQLALNRVDKIDIPVEDTDWIFIKGGETFVSGTRDHGLPDNVCLTNSIEIQLNGKAQSFTYPKVTITELRQLMAVAPSDGMFFDLDDAIDQSLDKVERLIIQGGEAIVSVPCGNVGDTAAGLLKSIDADFEDFQKTHPSATLHTVGAERFITITDVALPQHWNHTTVDLLFKVPRAYPQAGLDMFWVSPDLKLSSGAMPRGAIANELIQLDKNWMRFSWHYSPQHPWKPKTSNVSSHFRFVLTRLQQAY